MTSKLRQRLPAALLVAACTGTVAVAVSGASGALGGLDFAPPGHWVSNPGRDLLFHVNGAAATVDTQAALPLDPGEQVYQGESSVFVVGDARIREFGKSSLQVENELPVPTGEQAIGVEAPGGPYLVFRKAGTVVRLGERPATIRAGTDLGDPVATPEGSLWLHRMATGVVCELAVAADQVSCPTVTPTGHGGELTVVGSTVVFVDTTTDTVQTVTAQGLGDPVNIGVDLPPTATIADADAAGRIAAVDPGARRLHLIDTAGLGTGGPAASPSDTVTVPLPDGEYTSPEPSGSSVVLLDKRSNAVHTYTSDGKPQAVTPVPPETGVPRLHRGADGRVYVDGDQGGHVMVVDEHGAVNQVPLVEEKPGGTGDPQAPPPEPQPDKGPQPPPAPDAPPTQAGPPPQQQKQALPSPEQPQPKPQPPPKPQPQPQPEPKPQPAPKPEPQPDPAPKPLPASPPGVATNLTTKVDGTSVQFTWGAAAPNGGKVTAYHVSWKPAAGAGSLSTPGSARSATLSGLKPGTGYTVTIVAENSAGQGAAASTKVTIPGPKVSVTRGKPSEYDGCGPPCHKMRIRASGLEPNTEYEFNPFSNHPTWENPGSGWTTDENGEVDFQNIDFGEPGYEVWVVIQETGTTSPHYTWPG